MLRKRKRIFRRGLEVAFRQQAKSWELSAAMSLARLWPRPGQAAASARTARSGLRWFTEAFDTLDLKEAKALLEELA